jgi:Na+/H+-translocating membrane pyrophosphatase
LEKDLRYFIDESILCYDCWTLVGAVISSVEYYTGLGTKPVMAIVQKSSTGAGTKCNCRFSNGNDFYISYRSIVCCCNLDFYALQDFME